jgi:uncharacterized protein (DUF2336 family)
VVAAENCFAALSFLEVALSLSQSDVALLTQDSSPRMRAAVAEKLARQLESPDLTTAEVEVAQEVVRILARDIEATVRRTLAEGLRHSTRLPIEVARRLANDIEEVALPILADSDVLTSEDLIAIIGSASSTKESAIACRANLPEEVSDALVTAGQASAVAVLMQNATARIAESSLNKALRRFPDDDAVKEGMAHREALPISVVERLVTVASGRLKTYVLSHQAMSVAVASDIVLQTREQATLDLSYGRGEAELLQLVRQMHVGGRLAPSLVLRAICLGTSIFSRRRSPSWLTSR